MNRVYNFAPGPSMLPEAALQKAAAELLDFGGTGMSVMEMSHRSKVFDDLINESQEDLRDLLSIPSDYKILYLQGGAHLQ